MSQRRLAILLFTLIGCAAPIDPEAAPSTYAVTLSASDAAAVLDLVNYPGVDHDTLDHAVALDVRAATHIIAHRAGPDGLFPSADDDDFDDIAELDAIPYVGDSAFAKLHAYAQANPAPSGETVEGVSFRGWEAEIALWGVNTLELSALDAFLDARAAANLVDARPFASVGEIGPLGYVGPSALGALRAQGPAWWASRAGSGSLAGTFDGVSFDEVTAALALDIANQATQTQMVDHGVYGPGAGAIVDARPYASLAEVAAVSGVGPATMQGLHDYAASGAWPELPASGECVFGQVYRDLFAGGAIVVVAERQLDPSSSTNAIQRDQIVIAVQAAYEDVTTVSEAFAAVDQSVIHHVELWDASNRLAYTAYEFGAGDNSYGRIFAFGSTTIAATIHDGDLDGCTATHGDETQPCGDASDCAAGLSCVGATPAALGRCIDVSATEHAALGNACLLESGCPAGSGLVCAGAARGGAGLCNPAWMRGHFDSAVDGQPIPDGSSVVVDLPVSGLATVDTDVVLDLWIDHPRISDLRVTLTNPDDNEVLIFDGTGQSGVELYWRDHVVFGFSGDESVNGLWHLRVEDRVGGVVGHVHGFGLTITSRWD